MNESAVRTLAAVPSGAISMSNFYGKANRVALSFTFSSSTANASLNLSSIGGYRAGTSDITITINSGVYLWASSTGNYGLNITGGTTGDTLTVVNNGFIMGCGGRGGRPGTLTSGGPAVNLGFGFTSCTFNNTNGSAYIGGGGGGGSGDAGGGGAGGGAGSSYTVTYKTGSTTAIGGAGGSIGASGGNGGNAAPTEDRIWAGGGGGRIFPGVGGPGGGGQPGQGGGAGGAGGGFWPGGTNAGGGSANNAGANDTFQGYGGGGGGWAASGGSNFQGGGAAGGKAVNLNGKSITWVSGNTTRVWGAVS
jgi:hypothetical protein